MIATMKYYYLVRVHELEHVLDRGGLDVVNLDLHVLGFLHLAGEHGQEHLRPIYIGHQ